MGFAGNVEQMAGPRGPGLEKSDGLKLGILREPRFSSLIPRQSDTLPTCPQLKDRCVQIALSIRNKRGL